MWPADGAPGRTPRRFGDGEERAWSDEEAEASTPKGGKDATGEAEEAKAEGKSEPAKMSKKQASSGPRGRAARARGA